MHTSPMGVCRHLFQEHGTVIEGKPSEFVLIFEMEKINNFDRDGDAASGSLDGDGCVLKANNVVQFNFHRTAYTEAV